MIKPVNRKRCGILALLTNNFALGLSLYTKQNEVAQTAIYVNAMVILAWYTSEGFIEYLISKKLEQDKKE